VVATTNPELFELEMFGADVETEGELTTGMVVFDRRKPALREWRPNVEVALKADIGEVRECVLRGLERAGKAS
jgi:inosine-uridine nucleoside N-ribohydrolase